ncbi:MAG: hypothetical protein WBK88_01155 [Methanothrix sp.]
MRTLLVFIPLLLGAALQGAVGEEPLADEWLGIGGLRIVDVHHTEGYLRGVMNLSGQSRTGWMPPALPVRSATDVAGVWSFTLLGRERLEAEVALYQVDGEVFGEGAIASETRRWQVTAAGYATSNDLELRLVPVGDPALTSLRLSLLTIPSRGSYASYTPSGKADSGAAFGYRRGPIGWTYSPAPPPSVVPPDPSWRPGAGTAPA